MFRSISSILAAALVGIVVLAPSEANAAVPVAAATQQANATAATRLAGEAHARATKALRNGGAYKAELRKIQERMAFLEDHARKATAAIAEIKATLARLDNIEARLRKIEGRQLGLVVGAGADVRVGPAIPEVYEGAAVPYVAAEAGIVSQDTRTGWTIMGQGRYNPALVSPGFGGYGALYARNPWGLRRTALGGYIGGDFVAYDQGSQYGAYKATATGGAYFRVTLDTPRDGFGSFLTLRSGVYYGQAATSSASADEVGATITATLQGGKFWR